MAEIPLNTIFAFRRDTSTNWGSSNPTLEPGEPGFDLDTKRLKIGDGANSWATLNWLAPDIAIYQDAQINFNSKNSNIAIGKPAVSTSSVTGDTYILVGSTWDSTSGPSAKPGNIELVLSAATQSTIGADSQLSIRNYGSGASYFGPRPTTTSGNAGVASWYCGPWYQIETSVIKNASSNPNILVQAPLVGSQLGTTTIPWNTVHAYTYNLECESESDTGMKIKYNEAEEAVEFLA